MRTNAILLAAALAAATVSAARAAKVVVTGDRVNLRATAKGESEVVTQLSYGEELELHGSPADPWVAVAIPERCDVWISSPFLTGDEVNVRTVHLRAGAGLNYSVVGDLHRGDKVKIRGKSGDWTKIAPPQIAGVSAYVTNAYVKVKAEVPPPAPQPQPPAPRQQPAPAPVQPLVVPVAPAPTAAPAQPAQPIRDVVDARSPESPVAPRPAPPTPIASDKGRPSTLLGPAHADSGAKVGPAGIPASRLRSDVAQASSGAFSGTLARTPRFGSHPTKFRLVRFDAKGDPETVAYVHGNSGQLGEMNGSMLTIVGAVYWFKETALPTVFAQEIRPHAR